MTTRNCLIGLVMLILLPGALAQDDGHGHDEGEETIESSGPLHLLADGSLASITNGASSECLAIDAQTPSQSSMWTSILSTMEHHIESSTVTLALEMTPGGTTGNGFSVTANLQTSDGESIQATHTTAAGAAAPANVLLAFPFTDGHAATGATILDISLDATTVGPVASADIGIQCNHEATRIHSFEYATFTHEDDHSDEANVSALTVILISIGAAVVTVVAGILPLIGRALSPGRLHLFLGITAGLLLSIAIIDLIPSALQSGGQSTAWTLGLGVLVLYAVKHFAGEHGHAHGDHEHHEPDADDAHTDPHAGRFAAIAFGALLFHRLVDGLALPGAFAAGGSVGFAASSAILIHQFPDGLAAATVFLSAGWKRSKILLAVAGLAFATPVGSLLGLAISGIEGTLPHLLALAAATFIFIALAELLPELRAKRYRTIVITGFLIGYALTFGIELFADMFGGDSHGH